MILQQQRWGSLVRRVASLHRAPSIPRAALASSSSFSTTTSPSRTTVGPSRRNRRGASSLRWNESAKATTTTTAPEPRTQTPPVHAVYVHHLTKLVLQHLQETKAEWLQASGLDRGLRINANGTAVLQFPPQQGLDAGRIWTTYEASSKQHWLCVYKGKLVGRFLLKDTSKQDTSMARPKSFSAMMQTDTKIRQVVDEMVRKVSSP